MLKDKTRHYEKGEMEKIQEVLDRAREKQNWEKKEQDKFREKRK